jgi:membrane-associated phospholipid phosphatase
VVAGFVAVALARSAALDIPLRDPHGGILANRLLTDVVLLVVLALGQAAWLAVRRGGSLRRTWATLRGRWSWQRLALVAGGVLGYHLVYACYRNLKSWDAFLTPRDDALAAVDRALFGGEAPAVLLHQLLGHDHAAVLLAAVYDSFPKLVTITLALVPVFARSLHRTWTFYATMTWIWILGTITYYAVPSLGPFVTSPQHFDGLTRTAVTESQERYLVQRADLLADPSAHGAFASISAFASLHVGVTCTIMLLALQFGHRRLTAALAVYLALTMVATVYNGMHFVVDDVAGVLIAVLALVLGRLTAGPLRRVDDVPGPAGGEQTTGVGGRAGVAG